MSGWLEGKRARENFPNRPEAEAERQILERRQLQSETGIRTAATRLSDDQLHEAEGVFRRLHGQPHLLAFCVECTLANYRAPELERDLISAGQVASIKKELKVPRRHLPSGSVAELQTAQLTAYCERGKPSLKTYNNRRGILGTYFRYPFRRTGSRRIRSRNFLTIALPIGVDRRVH